MSLNGQDNQTPTQQSTGQVEDGELMESGDTVPNEVGNVQEQQSQASNLTANQPEPSIHNFAAAAVSSDNSGFGFPQVDTNPNSNFSFDSDSEGGLAIAEDDEMDTSVPSPQKPEEPKHDQRPVGSVDSAASAEHDGFEVIQMAQLQGADSANSTESPAASLAPNLPSSLPSLTSNPPLNLSPIAPNLSDSTSLPSNSANLPLDHANTLDPSVPKDSELTASVNNTWSDHSPGALQIDEEDNPDKQIDKEEKKALIGVVAPALKQETSATSGFGEVLGSNNLIPQQGPSEEVIKLMNEQAARELREKLELEQKRQAALAASSSVGIQPVLPSTSSTIQVPSVGDSKISVNALYSLGGGAPIDQLPKVANIALPSASQGASDIVVNAIPADGQQPKRREAYRWASNLPIFAMGWSYKRYPNQRLRLACSSIRDGHELLKNTMSIVEFDEEHGELTERTQVFIGAPSCELKFIPTTDVTQPDLIASATRELRIYSYHAEQQEVVLEAKLCPNKSYAYAGPLTSIDWNEVDTRIVGGSSIDSTCTIWDVEAQESIAVIPPPAFPPSEQHRLKYKIQTQLIAHEKPVHDMAFSRLGTGREYFASCGADGSVRLFDLRNLKNSTILYEHPEKHKLNHISWNKVEPAQFVIVADSSNELVICDVRMPCRPLIKYSKHSKPVNSVDWAPHSPTHFCSGSSDHEALIWQLQANSEEPLLAYKSDGEITRIRWSSTYNNWIGISFANYLEILRV